MLGFYGFGDVGTHANMLLDRARVDAFARALKEVVRPGDVVADIGAGSGVLSVLAAKAGARRVYAVERGPMASAITAVAADNGVADRITVLAREARGLRFDEEPSLLVSETIGSFGLEEDIVGLIATVARSAPSARVMPSVLSLHLALASLPELRAELDALRDVCGVDVSALRTSLAQRVAVAHVGHAQVVSDAPVCATIDVGVSVLPQIIMGRLTVERAASVDAVVGWFSAQLSPSVVLASGPSAPLPSWANVVFPLDPPLPTAVGDVVHVEVRPRLVTDRDLWSWRAYRGNDERVGDAMRSLLGDADALLAQLGLARSGSRAKGGQAPADVVRNSAARFADQLRAAFPDRYADDSDAEQDVFRLLLAEMRSRRNAP